MNKTSLLRSKKLWIIIAIPLLIIIYFFDNIKGQYRFMQYCKNEGGLRIYEKLEKNVGWHAKDYDDAKSASLLEHVGFVRFLDKKNNKKEYDLRYLGGSSQQDDSFDKSLSDKKEIVKYFWRIESSKIHDELRLSKTSYEVFNANNNKLLVRYYRFTYSQFDQNKTILGAPSSVYCYHEPARSALEISGWRKEINTAFLN